MKAVKYLMAAALAVLAMGCNKEQVAVEGTPDGQEVTVTFTAGLPGTPATKAIGDGTTAKNLAVAVYEDNSGVAGNYIQALDKTATFTGLKATVDFSLVKGKTYHFIFWAQAADATCYTFNKNTKEIAIDYAGAANDESRDAFFAVKTVKVTGAMTEPVELHRPFAQVNFGTADYDAAVAAGVVPAKSVVVATDVATSFLPFEGKGVNAASSTATDFTLASFPTDPATITVEGEDYKYLAMNYIIPAGEIAAKHVTNLTAKFYDENGHQVGEDVNVPSAPVQANWRTNIVGNLFTDQVNFNVEIKPAFETPDNIIDFNNITTSTELQAVFSTGGEAKLAGDIVLDKTISVPAGKSVVLDLDGHTINNTTDIWDESTNSWSLISVAGGSLTIKNGTVKAKADDVFAVDVQDGGTVIIEGGTFVGNMHAVYVYEGTAKIYGGHFSIQQQASLPNPYGYVLNCYDDNRRNGTASIIVYGGEFEKFNPADCAAEGAHTNFCAPGYKSKKISDNPDVYAVVDANLVSTAAELDEAIANAAPNAVIRLEAGTYENVIKVTDDKVITFKPAVSGADVVIAGINAASNGSKSNCVFEDITIDNSLQTTGWFVGTAQNLYPCVGVWGGAFTFKNCKFIVEGTSGKETGVMTWWTVAGNPVSLTFEGCTFEGKDNHAEARAMQIYDHVNLTVDNCKLTTAKRYAIKYAGNEGFTCTVKNCSVSNCEYTVELGSDLYPGSKYTVNFENNTLASGIFDYKIANAENAIINGGVAKQ